jgi:ribulose-bisphosphate carboxylase large chain
MAVGMNYIAQRGFKPSANHLISLIKIEFSESAIKEAGHKNIKWSNKKKIDKLFLDAAASVAAESSTGTWTKVYDGQGSGIKIAEKYRALVYDLDYKNHMFKVAYPLELFEIDNMSGLLAGIVGNIAGMKMVKAMRVMDICFPKKMIQKYLGPRYGVRGIRKMLNKKRGVFLATVPKPKIGRSDVEQHLLAREMFNAGDSSYDGIKDDENLTSLYFNNFDKRAKLILNEIKSIEKKSKNKKFYICNTTHSNIMEMKRRAEVIKRYSGRVMMMDVVTTGFSAVDSIRRMNLGLAIYAHRAMHGFITRDNSVGVHGKGDLNGFSISYIVLSKIYRLLGVDFLHGGSPLAKMEDYGEAEYIREVLQDSITRPHKKIPSLGQNWYHIKPTVMVASGGLHPGDFESVIGRLGEDIVVQCGGGVLGHPNGVSAGVIAAIEARSVVEKKVDMKKWVKDNPDSELANAVELWGYGPRIVY